ncbi:hypothetical protein [Nocardia sp. NPDC059228]|uniref:hypothetical protein n=1 Tax=Nocardia sp. NPDC059228 TaxID=3346777 RepID=UPI0036865CC0
MTSSRATKVWSKSSLPSRIWLLLLVVLMVILLHAKQFLGAAIMAAVIASWIRCKDLRAETAQLEQSVAARNAEWDAQGLRENIPVEVLNGPRSSWRDPSAIFGASAPLLVTLICCICAIAVSLVVGYVAGALVFFLGAIPATNPLIATENRDSWASRLRRGAAKRRFS